jgi:hypothetical protein
LLGTHPGETQRDLGQADDEHEAEQEEEDFAPLRQGHRVIISEEPASAAGADD